MISNARGSHSSPGIYTKEIDLSYAAKSLGTTTLGIVGETLKGPAFEPIRIENWKEFQEYFGGTSAEKFSGSKYPKYELPYIAQSYLKASKQLEVCRVLGLSGYNAGPAWLITASGEKYVEVEKAPETLSKIEVTDMKNEMPTTNVGDYVTVNGKLYEWKEEKYVVAVLRSRGSYSEYGNGNSDICNGGDSTYDELTYFTTSVRIENYSSATKMIACGTNEMTDEDKKEGFEINETNFGRITIVVTANGKEYRYPVTFNPGDKDYIISVLGVDAQDGDAPIFVEELYDVALIKMIYDNIVNKIDGEITPITEGLVDGSTVPAVPTKERVIDFQFIPENELTYKNIGQRYIKGLDIVVVKSKVENSVRKYGYETVETLVDGEVIYIVSKDAFYKVNGGELEICDTDINDYKEQFRCASTPWVVSELKGDGKNVDVKKLFRFHTISDGNSANHEVKVSIQNVRPDEGTFDVIVRAFDDTDASPVVLERFTKCSMVQGTNNYIALKIGTFDGEYVIKSKYITVEVIANDMTETCVPAGFLGYPMRKYNEILNPEMGYNVMVDEDIKPKRQYFGFSNLMGIDVDLFKYKGRSAYDNKEALSNGFHMDSYLGLDGMAYTVDGEDGFKFTTVSTQNYVGVGEGAIPRFGNEEDMIGTIYEDINLRKFTVCFYGGFDGWDIYRDSRTNSDKFKANKYRGVISKGYGKNFTQISNPEGLNLVGKCITSDYYAYLAGVRQFANPEAVYINIFATPGIDTINNTQLSQEVLNMVEEERGDALYIMTTPDKPFGSSDNNMFVPSEIVDLLRDAEIESSYAATYYPWVKYYDNDNKVYINLPATKDVVRSLAQTDNKSYPWFAPAGIIRGGVECEKAHFTTKLDDEDLLYENMINPIKTFATDGVKIWGQKTLYGEETPLNRINVRRLMLRVKQLINGACRRLIFEPNDATVKSQFEGLVKPILDDIKSKRGIYDYYLEVQDSPEARDRMELPAVIYIKPTKAMEYIDISFVIAPESAKFNE